jgi:hypothetical protein
MAFGDSLQHLLFGSNKHLCNTLNNKFGHSEQASHFNSNKHAYWQRWLLLLLPRAASPCTGGVTLKTTSAGSDEGRRRVVDGSRRAFCRAAERFEI